MAENKGQLFFGASLWILGLGIYMAVAPANDLIYTLILGVSLIGAAGGIIYS